MKKNIVLLVAFSLASRFISIGQIVILSTDMPVVGDTIKTATDTLTTGMTIGQAGPNRVWNFSAATPDKINSNYILNPANTPYAANFPTANRAITQDFTNYLMTEVTGQKYNIEGGTISIYGTPTPVAYNPVDEQYSFPTQYGGNFSGSWGYSITTPFSSLPVSVQQQIQSQLPAGVTVVQFKTTNTATFKDTIDGWGTTITPVCSYNSLREKRVETATFTIVADITYLGFPSTQSVVDSTATTTTYNWLAKETMLPLVTAGNLSGVNIGNITYSLIPPTLTANFAAATATSVCPGTTVSYRDSSLGCPDSWLWSFPGGTPSTSTAQNPTGIVYDTSGTYAATLTVYRGSTSISKTLTNYIRVFPKTVAQSTSDTICRGATASITASGGTTYLWNTGASTATISVSPLQDSTYAVTVTDQNSCTGTATSQVTVHTLPNASAGPNDTVCMGATGILVATGGVSYHWNTGIGSDTLALTALATAGYSVTVTDNNGCSASALASIVVKQLPVANAGPNDTICRFNIATLTATGGVSYAWSNGGSTAAINVSPASTVNYVVSVTGANGCVSQDTTTVMVNQLPVINLTNASICFGSTTILDAGNPGAIYLWSDAETTGSISVGTGGTYHVTVTDIHNCANMDSSVVTVGLNLTVNPGNHSFCAGDSVVLDAGNPGDHHVWSNLDTTQTITVLSGGTYSVTVTDVAGCEGQGSSLVVVNPNPVISAGPDDTICIGETAQLTGTGTGAFLWSTGATTTSVSVSPILTKTYTLQVTDSNSCTTYDSVTVLVNHLPLLTIGPNDTLCAGNTGTLTATGNGSFLWNTGETTASISHAPDSTTVYNVQLTDGNGCESFASAAIFVHQLPVADAGPDDSICAGVNVRLTATGGIQYQWSNGQMNATFAFTADSSAAFEVSVFDIYGCSSSDSVSVTVYPLPQVSITGLDSSYCPNLAPVTLNGTPSGGAFAGEGVSGNTFAPQSVPAGIINISYFYTDIHNCSAGDTQQVTVFSETSVNFASISPDYCVNGPKDTFAITPAGGVLSGAGITGMVFSPAIAGAGGPYPIVYARTDVFGCFYSDTAYITVKALPALSISGLDSVYCSTAAQVAIDVSPAGGFLTVDGTADSIFSPAIAGLGTHVVSYSYSANGCANTEQVSVRVKVCTDIPELPGLPEVKIYPNPASTQVFVDCSLPKSNDLEITLLDVSGRIVYTSCCEPKVSINLQTLASGTYIVKIQSGKVAVAKKIIVSRN